MVLFLSTMARQYPAETNGLEVAKLMLTAYAQNGETPHQKAMKVLKDEVRTLF
jgi:Fe-S cluster assembly ATPase SufC